MKEENTASIRRLLGFATCTWWNIMQLSYVTCKITHNILIFKNNEVKRYRNVQYYVSKYICSIYTQKFQKKYAKRLIDNSGHRIIENL